MDEPETQVRLEVVEATMSSPMFRAEPDKPAVPAHDLPQTSDLPPVAALRVGLELDLAVVAALAVAGSFFAGDARVAVVAGSLGSLAVGYRRIDRRVPFSFGEGFLPHRSRNLWTASRGPGGRRRPLELERGHPTRRQRGVTAQLLPEFSLSNLWTKPREVASMRLCQDLGQSPRRGSLTSRRTPSRSWHARNSRPRRRMRRRAPTTPASSCVPSTTSARSAAPRSPASPA